MTRADLKHCGKIPDAREELYYSYNIVDQLIIVVNLRKYTVFLFYIFWNNNVIHILFFFT